METVKVDKYVSEKGEYLQDNLIQGNNNLLVSKTGSGKTHWCLSVAEKAEYTVLISPTRIIVDQMVTQAQRSGLRLVRQSDAQDWAFGEMSGTGKIWIGTFAALSREAPDWDKVDYLFIDEVHYLLDLSLFGKDSAIPVWQVLQDIERYPQMTTVALTASEELVLPLSNLFQFKKGFFIQPDEWSLKPENIFIYPTLRGINNIELIMHYIKTNVKSGEQVLFVARSYKELEQIKALAKHLPGKLEVATAQNKEKIRSYESIVRHSKLPDDITILATTSWISLGASIYGNVKHVISTFPNYSTVYQALSRVRSGGVNLVVFQNRYRSNSVDGFELTNFQEVGDEIIKAYNEYSHKDSHLNALLFGDNWVKYKGELVFFPLPTLAQAYHDDQKELFKDLNALSDYLEKGLGKKPSIVWEELLNLRERTLTKQQFAIVKRIAQKNRFIYTSDTAIKRALRVEVV